MIRRQALLTSLTALTLGATALLAACATGPAPPALPPVVFVHGNGGTAAMWLTTLWRFESNGWPRDRLHAVDVPYPNARDNNLVAQAGRTSAAENAAHLSAEVDKVLARTGAAKVVLVGNSRGGYAIRDYIANLGGDKKVDKAVLGGTPNHGVWANPGFNPNSEFNGAGAFLTRLNAPKGANGDEVTPGVQWLTLRSDNNDKFAQPDGVWIGAKGTPTNVTFDGPALKGATNVVLPGRDHHEVSFHADAFAQTYQFITGRAPASLAIKPEAVVVLNGVVSGIGPAGPSNLALVGATVEVFKVDPGTAARIGAALHKKEVSADGRWGPFSADANARYEIVVAAPGYATLHQYRSGFPRSSDIVNLRAERIADADKDAGAIVSLVRPRGYLGLPRDKVVLDGINPAPGVPAGVAGVTTSKLKLQDAAKRPVVAELNGERLVGAAWPARENRLVVLEFHD
jgi:triacylglycerol lipase